MTAYINAQNYLLVLLFVIVGATVSQCCDSDGLGLGLELLCRTCGHTIVRTSNTLRIPSRKALRIRNQTLSGMDGVLIQHFRNPAEMFILDMCTKGEDFEVVTVKSSDVRLVGEPYEQDSWFPGFQWTVAVCSSCGAHLGWNFKSTSGDEDDGTIESFDGLVLDYLLNEDFSDMLTVVPSPATYQY